MSIKINTLMHSKYNKNSSVWYMQIPLCWLQKILEDPQDTITQAICYGVLYYAINKVTCDNEDAAKRVVYDYYHHKDRLSEKLYKKIVRYIRAGKIIQKKEIAINGSENNHKSEIQSILLLFEEDAKFMDLCVLHEKIHQACIYYEYEPNPALYQLYAEPVIKFQKEHENLFDDEPLTMCNKDIAERFRDNHENLDLFLAYVGIKSLTDRRKWQRTTKFAVVSRLLGAKRKDVLQHVLAKNGFAKEIYNYYIDVDGIVKRHRFQKLINRLRQQKFIKSYVGLDRNIFMSFSLDMAQLSEAIIQWKLSRRYIKEEQEARDRIRNAFQNKKPK